MKESTHISQTETSADYPKLLYRRHYQAALASSEINVIMWLFALGAFLTQVIRWNNFLGVSLSVLYLILKNLPTLWLMRHITQIGLLHALSVLINILEIVGLTAVMYFLGGIEATYLTPLYCMVITFVGVFVPRGVPYVTAVLCSLSFSLMVAVDYFGFLPHQRVLVSYNPPWLDQLAICLVLTGLLMGVAFISSFTSDLLKKNRIKLRVQNEALIEKTATLEEKEKALELSYQELERRVEDRTAELTELNARLRYEIGERKQAEGVLKESEERYRLHFENAKDVILSLDREFIIRLVSPSIEGALGYKPEELLGRPILEFPFFSPPFNIQVQSDLGRILSGESIASTIYEFIAKKGGKKIGEISGSPLIQGDKIIGLMCVARDITERKQVEEALRRSEALLKQTQMISKVGGWEYDVTAKHLSWTEEVYRIYEVSVDYDPSNIEKNIAFYGPQDQSTIERAFWKAVEEGDPYDLELQLISATGTEKWVRTTGQAECLSGKTIRVFGNIMDITELKQIEENRLVMSKLESTGILAGGIAHDFNNLLSAIIGNLQLIMMEVQPDEETAHPFQEIEKAVWRARDLTKQLITFARGGDPITRLTTLPGLIEEQVEFTLSGSNVEKVFSFAPDLWPVMADGVQLKQVIRNIVLNAMDAMPEGGTVSVQAENVALPPSSGLPLPPDNYVKVSFTDQGSGIPEEIFPKIFDPYFSTRQRGDQKGMGLGLTICHSIIKKHGGIITVDTRLGKGTTFHIYLPAVERTFQEKHPVQRTSSKKGKILMMDDEEMIRLMVGEHLRRLGYDAELAENGSQAVEMYRREKIKGQPFDAVMLDLTVRGGMGGKEAIQELLKIDPSVKAIVCSGYDNDPVMENCRQYGFKGALAKPYLVSTLMEILSRVIGSDRVKEMG